MMRNKACHILLSAGVAVLAAAFPFPARALGLPPEIALDNLQKNIKTVRKHKNDDPGLINGLLVVQMAVPIGGRPEVLSLLDYVIKQSTNPASVEEATYALQLCVMRHKWQIKKAKYPEVAALMQLGLKQAKEMGTRLEVADTLPLLGAEYKEASYQIHLDILANPIGPVDKEMGLFLRTIREVIEMNRPEAKESVRQAVAKYHVREYVEEQIDRLKGQSAEKHYQNILDQLDSLNAGEEQGKKAK